jgi:hypothetical protein
VTQTLGLSGVWLASAESIEHGVQRLHSLVACRTLIGGVRDKQGGFVGGGEQNMRKGVSGLIGCEVAFFDGKFKHCADGSQSVEAF